MTPGEGWGLSYLSWKYFSVTNIMRVHQLYDYFGETLLRSSKINIYTEVLNAFYGPQEDLWH